MVARAGKTDRRSSSGHREQKTGRENRAPPYYSTPGHRRDTKPLVTDINRAVLGPHESQATTRGGLVSSGPRRSARHLRSLRAGALSNRPRDLASIRFEGLD